MVDEKWIIGGEMEISERDRVKRVEISSISRNFQIQIIVQESIVNSGRMESCK